jgi:hypothetical protein
MPQPTKENNELFVIGKTRGRILGRNWDNSTPLPQKWFVMLTLYTETLSLRTLTCPENLNEIVHS